MIIKGEFEFVSMAIYGETVNEAAPADAEYVTATLPVVQPTPVSEVLNPANSRDPSHLAKQLLALIPNAPPLPLVIRLMFCLKPENEDWDDPNFPYIHPDLDDPDLEVDLERVSKLTTRPVADDISEETLDRFAECVAESASLKVLKF